MGHPLSTAGGALLGALLRRVEALSAQLGQTPSGQKGALICLGSPPGAQGRWLQGPLSACQHTHPPPEECNQLHQQPVLYVHAQVQGDALGLGLALGDDLQRWRVR